MNGSRDTWVRPGEVFWMGPDAAGPWVVTYTSESHILWAFSVRKEGEPDRTVGVQYSRGGGTLIANDEARALIPPEVLSALGQALKQSWGDGIPTGGLHQRVLDVLAAEMSKMSRGEWVAGRILRAGLGGIERDDSDQLVRSLAPRYLRRQAPEEGGDNYSLTLAGMLESARGEEARGIIGAVVRHIGVLFRADPHVEKFKWEDAMRAANLPAIGTTFAWRVLHAAALMDGGNLGSMTFRIPVDTVEDVAKCSDVNAFLEYLRLGKSGCQSPTAPRRVWRPPTSARASASPAPRPAKPRRDPSTTGVFETAFQAYRRVGDLGQGRCGRVFEVEDRDRRRWALKLIVPDRISSTGLKRFKNELVFCAEERRNIVHVVDWGFVVNGDVKQPFYVTRRYASTLRKAMDGGLDADSVLRIFGAMLDGVEAAHAARVWHRDIKPENVLLDGTDVAIADFGAAHFDEDIIATLVETRPGDRLANFAYAAPEQRRKGGTVDGRADIFALGLILNEMFTGHVPLGTGHRSIGSVQPTWGYLDAIVDAMIRQDAAARPDSIDAIRGLLVRASLAEQNANPSRRSGSVGAGASTAVVESPASAPAGARIPMSPSSARVESATGLSETAFLVGRFLLASADDASGNEAELSGEDFSSLGLDPVVLNAAVADLQAEGLVKVRDAMGSDPYEFYGVEGTYELAHRLGADVLGYAPEGDVRQAALAIMEGERVDAQALQATTGLSALRLNRAVDYLKERQHVEAHGLAGTAPFSFHWVEATHATRRFLQRDAP